VAVPVTTATPDAPRVRAFGRGAGVLAGWYLTAVTGVALWWWSLPGVNSYGGCEGLGFGCTLNPRDGVLLAATIVFVPALAVCGVIALAVLGGLAAAGVRSGVVAGTAALVVSVAVVIGGFLLWSAR
jgi:hypothetical protein